MINHLYINAISFYSACKGNKINNLSDSPFFVFHLISSFSLGHTKSVFQTIFPTTSRSSENILLQRIDELLQPKEKMTNLSLMGISLLEFCSSQR